MNRYFVPILISCLTLSLSAGVTAKGNGGMRMSQMPVFSDFDVNQDGLISEEEFESHLKARQELRKAEGRLLRNASGSADMFERIDSDHNEFIDTDEFQSHRGEMRYSKS